LHNPLLVETSLSKDQNPEAQQLTFMGKPHDYIIQGIDPIVTTGRKRKPLSFTHSLNIHYEP
jgi:hypothetical protein